MSYGYRLNVEQLMLKNANEKWLKALERFTILNDSSPEDGAAFTINAPAIHDEDTISLCIEAVLGWAISTEAFVNLAWQTCPDTKGVNERKYKTIEKVKFLCKVNGINYGTLPWRDNISELFNLRNSLVHYKTPITYVGFGFITKYQRDLSQGQMVKYQGAVTKLINELGGRLDMSVDFTSGDYELFYYSV